jgi:23S rRNA pseudouridine2605 synthase
MILPEGVKSKEAHHVGRLDRDTSGLLLFSNDGDHTFTILNSPILTKTYLAQITKPPTPQQCQQLIEGVPLKDGTARALSVSVIRETECRSEELRPLFLNARVRPIEKEHYFLRIITRDGRYRVVRRMLAAVGLPVVGLHRESVGPISLPTSSVPGECVSLDSSSIADLIHSSKNIS